MSIDEKTINKLEELSMLKLSTSEKEALIPELQSIIGMVDKLAELDTTGVAPLTNVNNHKQELREDIDQSSLTKEQALSNAKEIHEDFFVVPKVISTKDA